MKYLPLLSLALLTACNSGPKFKNPVAVIGKDVPILERPEAGSKVLALADVGDTLELKGIDAVTGLYQVAPDANYSRFKGGVKTGFVTAASLVVPAEMAVRAKAGILDQEDAPPPEKPEHLNQH
jgi:hypothetical protein